MNGSSLFFSFFLMKEIYSRIYKKVFAFCFSHKSWMNTYIINILMTSGVDTRGGVPLPPRSSEGGAKCFKHIFFAPPPTKKPYPRLIDVVPMMFHA